MARSFLSRVCAAAFLQQVSGATLNILQWNPHWQCFQDDTCKINAIGNLNTILPADNIDFANVVELQAAYTPPAGWTIMTEVCGLDTTSLIFNSQRWLVLSQPWAKQSGCMVDRDRPFIVQLLESASGLEPVIVIAAHYPHSSDRDSLRLALATVMNASRVKSVVLIADTNEFDYVSNEQILADIGVSGPVQGSELFASCCYDSDYYSSMTFDRVIASFGCSMRSSMLFDPVPEWAKVGEFHKAILAHLEIPPRVNGTLDCEDKKASSKISKVAEGDIFVEEVHRSMLQSSILVASMIMAGLFVFLVTATFRLRSASAWDEGLDTTDDVEEQEHLVPAA